MARRYMGGPAALAAPILFVLAPYPILEHGWREGVQDSALTLLMTLGAALFIVSWEMPDKRWPWIGIAAAGRMIAYLDLRQEQ